MESFWRGCEVKEDAACVKPTHPKQKAKLSRLDTEGNQGKKYQFCLLSVHVCLASAVEEGLMNVILNTAD